MNMRINGSNNVLGVYRTQSNDKTSRLTRKDENRDSIVLSNQAKAVQSAYQKINSTPDIREDIVKEVSERYDRGEMPTSKEIADKMVDSFFDKKI